MAVSGRGVYEMLSREDWDVYQLGSPYWAGVGDRILAAGVNDDEFWEDLFQGKGGKGFSKRLDCPENRATLLQKYQQKYPGQPVVRSALNELLWKLMISSNLDFIDPNAEEPDTRPRDAQGRLMSAKDVQWQAWEAWCNNPETSMRLVQEKRRTDPGFAEFYAAQSAAERTVPVDGAVENLNLAPPQKVVSDEVEEFAARYRTMSLSELKKLLSPGLNPGGPAAAKRANELFQQAIACGRI
jgi:hypothetical protein